MSLANLGETYLIWDKTIISILTDPVRKAGGANRQAER